MTLPEHLAKKMQEYDDNFGRVDGYDIIELKQLFEKWIEEWNNDSR